MPIEPERCASSTVESAADLLRDYILAMSPGTYIGSREDIARLLDVGIVTVQQVSRVLEYEGLLVVRRGVGGGYFSARPDVEAVTRAIAIYVRSNEVEVDEALHIAIPLMIELVRRAAASNDQDAREALGAMSEIFRAAPVDFRSRRRTDEEFRQIIFRLARAPLTELIVCAAFDLFYRNEAVDLLAPEIDCHLWADARIATIEAILAHDGDGAARHSRTLGVLTLERFTAISDDARTSSRT